MPKIISNISTDLIIPLGNQCVTTYFLKENNLRKIVTPFDWTDTRFMDLNKFLYYFEDFSNFLKARKKINENYIGTAVNNNDNFTPNQNIQRKMSYIQNINMNMICLHYFQANTDIDEFYNNTFFPMMKKRFDRLTNCIKYSKNITFVSFFREDCLQKKLQFLKDFNSLFKYPINYIYQPGTYNKSIYSYENCKYKIIETKMRFLYDNDWNSINSTIIRQTNLKRLADKIQISDRINFSKL